jgi:hypothetical protein
MSRVRRSLIGDVVVEKLLAPAVRGTWTPFESILKTYASVSTKLSAEDRHQLDDDVLKAIMLLSTSQLRNVSELDAANLHTQPPPPFSRLTTTPDFLRRLHDGEVAPVGTDVPWQLVVCTPASLGALPGLLTGVQERNAAAFVASANRGLQKAALRDLPAQHLVVPISALYSHYHRRFVVPTRYHPGATSEGAVEPLLDIADKLRGASSGGGSNPADRSVVCAEMQALDTAIAMAYRAQVDGKDKAAAIGVAMRPGERHSEACMRFASVPHVCSVLPLSFEARLATLGVTTSLSSSGAEGTNRMDYRMCNEDTDGPERVAGVAAALRDVAASRLNNVGVAIGVHALLEPQGRTLHAAAARRSLPMVRLETPKKDRLLQATRLASTRRTAAIERAKLTPAQLAKTRG